MRPNTAPQRIAPSGANCPDEIMRQCTTVACQTALMTDVGAALQKFARAPLRESRWLSDLALVSDDDCFFAAMGRIQRGEVA